jgi:hypothetical protein
LATSNSRGLTTACGFIPVYGPPVVSDAPRGDAYSPFTSRLGWGADKRRPRPTSILRVAASCAETLNAWSVRREVHAPRGRCPSMTQEPNTSRGVSWMGKFRTTVEPTVHIRENPALFEPFENTAHLSYDATGLPSARWRLQRSFSVQWFPMGIPIETPVPACWRMLVSG